MALRITKSSQHNNTLWALLMPFKGTDFCPHICLIWIIASIWMMVWNCSRSVSIILWTLRLCFTIITYFSVQSYVIVLYTCISYGTNRVKIIHLALIDSKLDISVKICCQRKCLFYRLESITGYPALNVAAIKQDMIKEPKCSRCKSKANFTFKLYFTYQLKVSNIFTLGELAFISNS